MPGTPPSNVGGEFGDFRIDAELGRGAMGVVYRAWQHRMNRAVALKVLPADLADDPAYRARFAREAAALARLDSPHVIQIYDHGAHAGNLFLAMQLVQGPDLGQLLETGVISPRRALRITAQVASALGDGHAAGVVHRDVKPSNVLMRPRAAHHDLDDPDDPDADFVYLCDFGIARSAGDVAGAPETAGIVGTLGYLAPERLRDEPATPASDVYSLGCLLFALLVGTPPYVGSQADVVMGHLQAPVPQLDGGDPRTEMVNALLAGMLAKDPGKRPTIAELRQQVREILAVSGGPAPTIRRTEPGRFVDGRRVRRRVPVILAVGAALLAAGGALVAAALLDPAGSAQERLRQATPIGTTCVETAVPDASADAGALAQVVCGVGGDVGELRLVALAGAADDYLREVALQDPAALPGGSCPDGLPAAERWDSGRRGGTLLCFVVGPNTRYAWTFDDLDVVAVLDGRAELPFPRDLGAIDAFFTAAQYP